MSIDEKYKITATANGGAVYAGSTVKNLTVTDCQFDTNVAGLAGGGIEYQGRNCSVRGSS